MLAVWVFVGTALVILGDVLLMEATKQASVSTLLLGLGAVAYALSAYAWYQVLQHREFFQVGIIFGMCVIVGMLLIGIFWYGESPSKFQYVATAMAVVAVILNEF